MVTWRRVRRVRRVIGLFQGKAATPAPESAPQTSPMSLPALLANCSQVATLDLKDPDFQEFGQIG